MAKVLQQPYRSLVQLMRLRIDDAQGSDAAARGEDKRTASIEPDVRFAGDLRVVGKARVQQGV
ncbi:MAG TPA: hypothetical protein VHL31_01920, partial [Geminicoccus sp.]